ncbi:MAG TPA: hypothetical protein VES67_11450 [Vicinamibacterales bacterium]|nr:hypothetical protein [Vicinamibacterales bacterium]
MALRLDPAVPAAPTSSSTSTRIVWLPAAGALLVLFALATITSTDTDLWGHTRFGLDILRDHELPSDDPYSFTQDKPWVNHEWLSELQMGMAYRLAGPTGLALLKGALTFTALILIWSALRGIDVAPRIIIFAATAMSTVPVTRTLRPQAWSLLLLVILCRILIEDRQRARWLVPLMLALWANLHGGWIVGLGILLTWTFGEVVIRGFRPLTVAVLSLLATLVTPYGWRLWEFLLETVRMGRDITEWRPLWRQAPPDWMPWLAAVVVAIWLLRRPHRFRLQVSLVLGMLAFSSFRVMRIAPLFVACAAVLLSPWFRDRWPISTVAPSGAKVGDQRLVAAGLFVVALIAAVFIGSKSLTCVRTEGTWIPDRGAAQVLASAPAGRIVTFFNWGEFVIWHFGPRLRVSMDGRRETVYSDTRLLEHDAIVRGTPLAFTTLAAWNAEYVWLPARSAATRAWLVDHGYRIDKETDRSFVAVRGDLPPLVPVGPPPAAGASCFPD